MWMIAAYSIIAVFYVWCWIVTWLVLLSDMRKDYPDHSTGRIVIAFFWPLTALPWAIYIGISKLRKKNEIPKAKIITDRDHYSWGRPESDFWRSLKKGPDGEYKIRRR